MLFVLRHFLITWRLLRDNRVPFYAKAAFLLPLIYIISPFDFLPDFFLGIGQLDDLGLLALGVQMLESLSPPDVVAEHRTGVRQRLETNQTVTVEPSRTEERMRM